MTELERLREENAALREVVERVRALFGDASDEEAAERFEALLVAVMAYDGLMPAGEDAPSR